MDHGASWIARDYTSLAREGFMRNPVAHRCVRMIAEAASNVPWLLYAGATEHETHSLLEPVARPQCGLDGTTFFEPLYGHLLISGNAYVERLDLPSGRMELHLLRPERVSIITDADGWPQALVYRSGKAARRLSLGSDGAAALQLQLLRLLDDHYGFPPLEAALMALDLHNAAGAWNKALLDNPARAVRCFWKAAWTGRRWATARRTWISSKQRTEPPATSRLPSVCRHAARYSGR